MEIHKRWHRIQKSPLQAKSSAFQRQPDGAQDAAQEIDDDDEVKEVTEKPQSKK
jgi:hypothetical protein